MTDRGVVRQDGAASFEEARLWDVLEQAPVGYQSLGAGGGAAAPRAHRRPGLPVRPVRRRGAVWSAYHRRGDVVEAVAPDRPYRPALDVGAAVAGIRRAA